MRSERKVRSNFFFPAFGLHVHWQVPVCTYSCTQAPRMEERKIKEGIALMASGEKCLKTSMFGRWKPDWESATADYEKAATAFRVAKAWAQAVGAFEKAAQGQEQLGSGFMAAKHVESAAFLAGAGGLCDGASSAARYERAAALHQQDGRVENAAEALGKAAKALESSDPERAAKLMSAACDAFADDEADSSELRLIQSLDTYKTAVAFLLRAKSPAQAATMLQRQAQVSARVNQAHNVARCELSRVVALLAADRFQEAVEACDVAQQSGDGFAGTDEADAATALLDAYTSQSEDALSACVARQVFTFLDHQVTLAARALTLATASCPVFAPLSGGDSSHGPASGGGGGLAEGTGDFGEVAPEDEAAAEEEEEEELDLT